MIVARINKDTELPEGWFWKEKEDGSLGLGISWDFINGRPFSASSAKEFRKSPRHYSTKMIFGYKEMTEDQIVGRIVETLALEKHKFDTTFRVFEKATGTGSRKINNDAKEQAQADGVLLITPDLLKRAEYSHESLMDHKEARELIEKKKNVQQKLLWTDRKTKLPLIGYIDFGSDAWGENWIVDLKTGTNVDPDDFQKVIFKLGWDIQAAFYMDAYKNKFYQFPGFIFLGVETKEPYDVSINFMESKTLETAKDEFKGTLLAFKKCMDEFKFNEGYEFRLMQTRSYFGVRTPGYHKPIYGGLQ